MIFPLFSITILIDTTDLDKLFIKQCPDVHKWLQEQNITDWELGTASKITFLKENFDNMKVFVAIGFEHDADAMMFKLTFGEKYTLGSSGLI